MNESVQNKLETFFKQFKQYQYKKGEIIIRADDNPLGIMYLVSGSIRKYAISQKGDELVVNIFKPLSFFPMSWAINDSKNDYFYDAVTDVELWRAPKDEVLTFIKTNPDVLYDLMSRVYHGSDGMLSRMTYLMAGNAYGRLITEILIHAKRFGKKEKDNAISVVISEKELAAQSGMTRETVSREIRILKQKNLIEYQKNHLVIVDLAKLEAELEY